MKGKGVDDYFSTFYHINILKTSYYQLLPIPVVIVSRKMFIKNNYKLIKNGMIHD